jgi:prophage maintenance system killer protein
MHAVIRDHVFVDGNKRTGTVAAIEFLRAENVFTGDDLYADLQLALLGEVALATASGKLTVEQVTFWLHRIFEAPGA